MWASLAVGLVAETAAELVAELERWIAEPGLRGS
jgi:hypothetical protein